MMNKQSYKSYWVKMIIHDGSNQDVDSNRSKRQNKRLLIA